MIVTLNIPVGVRVETSDGVTFRTIQGCDFRYDNTTSSPRVTRHLKPIVMIHQHFIY